VLFQTLDIDRIVHALNFHFVSTRAFVNGDFGPVRVLVFVVVLDLLPYFVISQLLIIRLFQQSTRCCAKTESAPLELAVCLSNRIIRSQLEDCLSIPAIEIASDLALDNI